MPRLKQEDEVSEQIAVATRLFEQDQHLVAQAQERRAAQGAATEMGIPAHYLERAQQEIASRRQANARRHRRTIGATLAAAVLTVGLAGGWRAAHPPKPAPLAFSFGPASQGQWRVEYVFDKSGVLTFSSEAGHPATAKLHVPTLGGTAYQNCQMDLVTNQIPRSLKDYQTVTFRVRGNGLPQVRVFLQNGNDRWCSPFLTASGGWHTLRVPLSKFLHQTQVGNGVWQDAPSARPQTIGALSFKLGDDANILGGRKFAEKGTVILDNLKFE